MSISLSSQGVSDPVKVPLDPIDPRNSFVTVVLAPRDRRVASESFIVSQKKELT